MEIGIGLPNTVPGTTGRELTAWASAAEDAGFSSLGTIDRLVYSNYEPMTALAAAAAVTERIRLATTILLGPLRVNPTLLAKQALSVDALAGGGRMALGIAPGGREDDYGMSGIPMSERASWMDDALPQIRRVWGGEGGDEAKVGPRPQGGGPALILGGTADAAFKRAAEYGDGWIMGGGAPEQFGESVAKLEAAWRKAGRDGQPRKLALAYFSLGDDAERSAESYLLDYYAWLGDEISNAIADSAAKDAETVQRYTSAFESNGCDELFFIPCSSDRQQVSLLADAAELG